MGPLRIAGITIALVTFAACSKKDDTSKEKPAASKKETSTTAPAGNGGGCDRREKEHLCGEYHGKLATVETVKGECTAMGAPYVASCPTEGAVGRCVRDAGTPQETHTVFYDPFTKDSVAAMCSDAELREP